MKVNKQEPSKSYRSKKVLEFLDKHFPVKANKMPTIQRVTEREYSEFRTLFYRGAFPHMRFGQAFCNHFKDGTMRNVVDSELFYCEDVRKATKIIHEKYLEI